MCSKFSEITSLNYYKHETLRQVSGINYLIKMSTYRLAKLRLLNHPTWMTHSAKHVIFPDTSLNRIFLTDDVIIFKLKKLKKSVETMTHSYYSCEIDSAITIILQHCYSPKLLIFGSKKFQKNKLGCDNMSWISMILHSHDPCRHFGDFWWRHHG